MVKGKIKRDKRDLKKGRGSKQDVKQE